MNIDANANAYDIQQASFDVITKHIERILSKAELASIKKQAFNEGVSLAKIFPIFSLLLRDYILEKSGMKIGAEEQDPDSTTKT